MNACILYELDIWSEILLKYLKLKNCLFGATKIVKTSNKVKWFYSNDGSASFGAGWWSSLHDFAGIVVVFGVYNSSPCHSENRKVISLVFNERDPYDVNGNFASPEKKLVLSLVKQIQNFA